MLTISLLIYKDTFGSAVFPTITTLGHINQALKERTGHSAFKLQLIGYKTKKIVLDDCATLSCDMTIRDNPTQDIIIIPGIGANFMKDPDFKYYSDLFDWLRIENGKHTKIGSMCLGAVLPAEAGIMDGHQVTTHWTGVSYFKERYLAVKLQPELAVTRQGNIYSSGGAFTSIQLVLLFIEEYCGKNDGNRIPTENTKSILHFPTTKTT